MIKAMRPKKTTAPIRHATAVPIIIRLRTTLLLKTFPPKKAINSKAAVIATAISNSLAMQTMFSRHPF